MSLAHSQYVTNVLPVRLLRTITASVGKIPFPKPLNPQKTNLFSLFLSFFEVFSYICTVIINSQTMSTQTMMQQIAEYFKTQPVLKAWLFGSYSRGEQRADSDVDLLVKFDRSRPIGLFAYVRMRRELEERLGRKIDLVEEGTLRPAAQKTANQDLKVIYERNS